MERYDILEKLGSGGQGVVYRGVDTQTGNTVAIKQFKSDKDAVRESSILLHLRQHSLFGAVEYVSLIGGVLITEYLGTYTPLENIYTNLVPPQVADLSVDMINNIRNIHDAMVCHGDIKLANIMVDITKLKSKYIDFGMACLGDKCVESDLHGTVSYLSPDYLNSTPTTRTFEITRLNDLWGLGICIYVMVTKENPYVYTKYIAEGQSHVSVAMTIRAFLQYRIERFFLHPLWIAFAESYPSINTIVRRYLTITGYHVRWYN